jgi:hypothetical protein
MLPYMLPLSDLQSPCHLLLEDACLLPGMVLPSHTYIHDLLSGYSYVVSDIQNNSVK